MMDQSMSKNQRDVSSKESSVESKRKPVQGYSTTKYSKSLKQNFLKRHAGQNQVPAVDIKYALYIFLFNLVYLGRIKS